MNKEIKKFTIGIEEEYMVCNPQDGNLVDKASFIMDSFKDSERFSYELIESEIDKTTAAVKGRCRSAANKIKNLSADFKRNHK